ncbi:alpha/beta fold hydrolase [Phenylobacterium sp.]|uniref:alpha/beta fold hydrolase n=1 Tax=Phenylobacterium sp. TaxID=1871053 RepID=UPI0035682714
MKRLSGVLAGLAASALLAGASQAADPPPPSVGWWSGYLANAQLVRLPDGRQMHLYCEGAGGPVVVLDAGLGDGAWSWNSVQDQIATRTRVCSYDRAGYGRSSPGPAPRDSRAIVGDLAATLKAAGLRGPYILVGHSLASFDVRLFAFTYPKDVAGVVLVDPSADWQMKRMSEAAPKLAAQTEAAYGGMRPCAESPRPPERAKLCVLGAPGPSPEAQAFLVEARGPAYYRAMLGEMEVFAKDDNDQLVAAREARGPRPLGAKPLVILTAGKSASPGLTPEELEAVHKVWVTMHDEMAGLSSRGVNRIVEGSGHYIHQERPQVVVDAVFEVLDAARR